MWNDGVGLLCWFCGGVFMIAGMFLPSFTHSEGFAWALLGSGVFMMICAPWISEVRSNEADEHGHRKRS
jgi:membrane protein implicated in regulation of membrane protease activity